jgi:lactate dehydrogenase-like 2-hydroxyacid dehydrogenase
VSYYSRTRKPHEEERIGLQYAALRDLFVSVDAVIVMTPGNESTHHLIDDQILSAARPGLILINTAREDIVSPAALLAALQSGTLGYTGFDGFYSDDAPHTTELKRFIPERLTVTGHIASLTHEARDGMAIKAVRSILNILETGADDYIVNGSGES